MNIIAFFVLGLLIGWVIEWIMDWFYWRKRIRNLAEENVDLKGRIILLESKKNKRTQLSKTRPISKSGKDNLKAIRGIGPVIEKRLNQAGVYTFEELATLDPEELEEILGELIKRFFPGEDKMIAQAKEFAEQKTKNG